MHIVIMGCGRVGASVARNLSKAGHSVAVIDRDEAAFRRLGPEFAGAQILGLGFDRDTMLRARITEAHAFAAVSSGDNSNIIAARAARELFGVQTVVARIYDPKRAAVYERLGIPTVATVPWTTDRFIRELVPDGILREWRDPSGTVSVVKLPYHDDFIGRPLTELETATGTRACFVIRFGKGILPHADTVIQDGDLIYSATVAADLSTVAEFAATSPKEGA